MFDLFLSYRTDDHALVAPLVAALEARGVSVWQDWERVDQGGSISRAVREGIAGSRALLAFWGPAYAESRICLWELTLAFCCAEADRRDGARPTDRVGALVPPGGAAEAVVGAIRDGLFFAGAGDSEEPDWGAVADRIAGWLGKLDGRTLGELRGTTALEGVHWTPHRRASSSRFVGRLPELWALHAHLRAGENVVVTGVGRGTARVQGLAGVGKSLLALEYANRFEAAWPGGIFVVDAATVDADRVFADLAHQVGVPAGTPPEQRAAAARRKLAQKTEPYLWLVDNLPAELEQAEAESWLAPGRGATLFTTRGRRLSALGPAIDVDVLALQDALRLLTREVAPADAAEAEAARALCARVGGLPLALDVLRALVQRAAEQGRTGPYARWLRRLDQPEGEALNRVGELLEGESLPTGISKNVGAVLHAALEDVDARGWDVMRVCALLAEAPVPVSLVEGVVAAADGLGAAEAEHVAEAGIERLRGRLTLPRFDGPFLVE